MVSPTRPDRPTFAEQHGICPTHCPQAIFLVIVRTFIVQRLKTENPDVMGMAVLGAGEGQHPRSVFLSWEVAAAEPRPSCSCRDLEKNLSCTTLCQVQSHVGHGI